MVIYCKRSFVLRHETEQLTLPEGFTGTIPKWAEKHWLLKAAIADGSIIATQPASAKREDT